MQREALDVGTQLAAPEVERLLAFVAQAQHPRTGVLAEGDPSFGGCRVARREPRLARFARVIGVVVGRS
jgi:hypothetical protein